MKIYLVSSGEYSAYLVRGLFTDKAKAETFSSLLAESGVEEWDTDPELPAHPPGMKRFSVWMDDTGHCTYSPCQRDPDDASEPIACHRAATDARQVVCFGVWATDAQHAIKIANEKRIQLLAGPGWPQYKSPLHRDSGAVPPRQT